MGNTGTCSVLCRVSGLMDSSTLCVSTTRFITDIHGSGSRGSGRRFSKAIHSITARLQWLHARPLHASPACLPVPSSSTVMANVVEVALTSGSKTPQHQFSNPSSSTSRAMSTCGIGCRAIHLCILPLEGGGRIKRG